MKKETNKTETGKRKKKKVLRFFLILILIVALVFGFTSVSIWRYSHKDQRQKADVIIVLGGRTVFGRSFTGIPRTVKSQHHII